MIEMVQEGLITLSDIGRMFGNATTNAAKTVLPISYYGMGKCPIITPITKNSL